MQTPAAGVPRIAIPHETVEQLVQIAAEAFAFFPPLWIHSILGHPWTWIAPDDHSEFRILDPWKLRRSLGWFWQAWLPGFARTPFETMSGTLNPLFWRPSQVLRYPERDGVEPSFPDEAWFYINGIATDEAVARINARLIFELFRRPLTIVHNATNSIPVDLVECALGKSWLISTEPAWKAYREILRALESPRKTRVVIVCHSQGTIIMANVLRMLQDEASRRRLSEQWSEIRQETTRPLVGPTRPQLLRKLEIYAFANCADVMPYATRLGRTERGNPIPWIESFGNDRDAVARLGMLAPHGEQRGIRIDGQRRIRRGAWGHLLNEHYLLPIRAHLRRPSVNPDPYPLEDSLSPSRLYAYHRGATPEAY